MQQYIGMNYIGGFLPTRADFVSYNPATEEPIGCFPQSNDKEIDEALCLAQKSFYSWKSLSKIQRAEYFWNLCRIIESKVDYIAHAISLETGKTLNESRAEVIEALHMAQYCFGKGREVSGDIIPSELPERDSYTIRKPKGIVGVIAPWNFPFAIGGFWCAGPSLLEGNTVVYKPSELTPMVGQITAELYQEAGFPPGVFNLLHGDGDVGSKIVNDDRISHVAFTGSAEVGKSIRIACANSWHKTCSCEMGSKSAVMVFEDCDFDLAVSACLTSAFKLSGQRCVSSGRILVQRSILEKFIEAFTYQVSFAAVSDPFNVPRGPSSVVYGPLISKEQMNRVISFNDMVRNDPEACVLYDLDRDGLLSETGWFLRPFVYQIEWCNKPYLKQEVFGPHVAIIPFDDVEDAIRIYNDTDYGLSLGVITSNFKVARKVRDNCDFGLGYWNLPSIGAESQNVFGGVKKSGNGWPSAAGMFDAITHKVAWTVNHSDSTFTMPQGLK
jgi:aldehyde dehydrogenase (NAD+)